MNRPGEVTAYLAGVEERSRQTLSGTQSFGHGATMQASAADVPPLLAAVEKVLGLAGELDAEDGYDRSDGERLGRSISRGDRIREAISRALLGEVSGGTP